MGCEICGRNSCIRSFHSLEVQERFDARQKMSDDVEVLRQEIQELQDRISELEQENRKIDELENQIIDLQEEAKKLKSEKVNNTK